MKQAALAHRGEHAGSLRPDMGVQEFDDGYYYAAELKAFARTLGISGGRCRKIELEQLIRQCLATGKAPAGPFVLPRKAGQPPDRLAPDALVKNYVDNRATKEFLLACVRAGAPGLKDKSGQWYWLNDWRRSRQQAQSGMTYKDLARRLRELMQTQGRLPQIPSARMNNFISDYRADPANPPTSRSELMQAWQWLKSQPGPKTYAAYRQHKLHGATD